MRIEGMLATGDGHEIHYLHCGNKAGPCFLFLHGGPGIGFSHRDQDYFDLDLVNVIFFDQRGSGKSTPKRSLEANTSQALLSDIDQLLDYLNIDSCFLFGGSWGSTLALLYGIHNPRRVRAMILRGLFTATKKERIFFEQGGIQDLYPDIWQRFAGMVPEEYRDEVSKYYFSQILHGTSSLQNDFAFELEMYGYALSTVPVMDQLDEGLLRDKDYLTRAMILAHYSVHNFFIEEGYIEKHKHNLTHIPITVIQGNKDYITRPVVAMKFAEDMSNVDLQLVDGGHSPFDPEIQAELTEAVRKLSINR